MHVTPKIKPLLECSVKDFEKKMREHSKIFEEMLEYLAKKKKFPKLLEGGKQNRGLKEFNPNFNSIFKRKQLCVELIKKDYMKIYYYFMSNEGVDKEKLQKIHQEYYLKRFFNILEKRSLKNQIYRLEQWKKFPVTTKFIKFMNRYSDLVFAHLEDCQINE